MNPRHLILALTAFATVAASARPATADVLCKKKSGAVFERIACKRKETRIDPDALGLRGSKGDPGQQGTMGSPGATGPMGPALVVKDANGSFVGLLPGLPAPLAFRTVGNVLLRFMVNFGVDSALLPSGDGYVYYTSTDCSGAALTTTAQCGANAPYCDTWRGPGGTLIYPAGPWASYTANSENLDASFQATSQADCDAQNGAGTTVFTPPDQCCRATAYNATFSPIATIDSSGASLGLVPPFHVEGP